MARQNPAKPNKPQLLSKTLPIKQDGGMQSELVVVDEESANRELIARLGKLKTKSSDQIGPKLYGTVVVDDQPKTSIVEKQTASAGRPDIKTAYEGEISRLQAIYNEELEWADKHAEVEESAKPKATKADVTNAPKPLAETVSGGVGEDVTGPEVDICVQIFEKHARIHQQRAEELAKKAESQRVALREERRRQELVEREKQEQRNYELQLGDLVKGITALRSRREQVQIRPILQAVQNQTITHAPKEDQTLAKQQQTNRSTKQKQNYGNAGSTPFFEHKSASTSNKQGKATHNQPNTEEEGAGEKQTHQRHTEPGARSQAGTNVPIDVVEALVRRIDELEGRLKDLKKPESILKSTKKGPKTSKTAPKMIRFSDTSECESFVQDSSTSDSDCELLTTNSSSTAKAAARDKNNPSRPIFVQAAVFNELNSKEDDAIEWFRKFERAARVNGWSDAEMANNAVLHFEGEALDIWESMGTDT